MAPVGGSLIGLTLDGRVFPIAADADANRKLGGFENEMQANGDGSARLIKNRVLGGIDGLTLSMDDDRGDHEFLQALTDRNGFFPIALTYASGNVYQGTGQIVGETQAGSQSATAPVSVMVEGELTKQ